MLSDVIDMLQSKAKVTMESLGHYIFRRWNMMSVSLWYCFLVSYTYNSPAFVAWD